jgi:hypothetical protein
VTREAAERCKSKQTKRATKRGRNTSVASRLLAPTYRVQKSKVVLHKTPESMDTVEVARVGLLGAITRDRS